MGDNNVSAGRFFLFFVTTKRPVENFLRLQDVCSIQRFRNEL